jgi:hypothetical protein
MNLELDAMTEIAARDALSDAIRYWEPRRILYNVVLLLIVGLTYWANLPASRSIVISDSLQALFALAVLANVAYCAAYAVDIVAQISTFRGRWLRVRWIFLAVGMLFAGVLAHFFSGGLFARSV